MPFKKGHKINFGKIVSVVTREKISEKLRGHKLSKKSIEKRTESRKGYKHSTATKIKMSEVAKLRVSEGRHNNYKGGITSINKQIRKSIEYRLVREACFKRDDYTCVWCFKKGSRINADHIKSFALFPELRFALDNLRTLCVPCHKTTETYGGKTKS
jgi:hypothetical protein